jgi:predicted enzyme related to lactoylglutathione lyase
VSFYRTVLGWDISDPDLSQTLMPSPIDGTDGVHMFQKGNLAGAFVKMSRPEGVAAVADREYLAKSPVLAYYLVERIEETLEKVEKAGGQVHMCVSLSFTLETEGLSADNRWL